MKKIISYTATRVYYFHYQLLSSYVHFVIAFTCFVLVKVSDVLWNLYSYYKQFIPCIEQTLQEMRKPIEKDLKVCNCNVE